jgi:multiple sugar transport system permease protein
VIVATTMVPAQILLVPMYLLLNALGWIDSYAALLIPAGANSFAVFMLYQFFRGIPRELDEAAAIDGCSPWGIFFRILLPLAKPALATLAIFTFIGTWNDFVGPLIYLDSNERLTMPVGIALFQTSYFNDYGITLAASVLCTFPVLILFAFFQKALVRGIAMTGIKE